MSDQETQSVHEQRDQMIRDLEARSARRRFGVRWSTALVAIAMAVGLFFWFRVDRDLAYYFSASEPITLGSEGAYAFDRLRSNRYAQIHGLPTNTGLFLRKGNELMVLVGLQNTPVLVQRAALDTESDKPPTPVDTRPFGIRGRLLAQEDAPRLERGFEQLSRTPGVVPKDGRLWVVVEGERPRGDASALLLSGLLSAFVIVNAWFLVRDLASRRRR